MIFLTRWVFKVCLCVYKESEIAHIDINWQVALPCFYVAPFHTILTHKQSEKLFCLVLNRPSLVGKSPLWSAFNCEMELNKAQCLLMAHVSASEWLWLPGSEVVEIGNTMPQTRHLPCAKSYWDSGSNSGLYPILREGKEKVEGGLGFLKMPSLTVKAIQMRGSAQFQDLYKTVSWHCSNTIAAEATWHLWVSKSQWTVTTRAMPVGFWTHSRTSTEEGQFAHGQLGLMALSQIKSVITPENLPRVYALWQSATGRGQMAQQTGMAALLCLS